LLLPFLITSIPAAFLGGYLPVPDTIYLVLLYLSLTYVAYRMLFLAKVKETQSRNTNFHWSTAALAGGLIGLLSGVIGIGGGIFLSPLIVLTGWGTPKQAAASAAAFIFINSISGLTGRVVGESFEMGVFGLMLIPLGIAGALGGSYLGARYLSSDGMRRLLGIILLIAVSRFWFGLLG
jgi:uncharacterized membrane protein YfcA